MVIIMLMMKSFDDGQCANDDECNDSDDISGAQRRPEALGRAALAVGYERRLEHALGVRDQREPLGLRVDVVVDEEGSLKVTQQQRCA